jgi:hypothetical protein
MRRHTAPSHLLTVPTMKISHLDASYSNSRPAAVQVSRFPRTVSRSQTGAFLISAELFVSPFAMSLLSTRWVCRDLTLTRSLPSSLASTATQRLFDQCISTSTPRSKCTFPKNAAGYDHIHSQTQTQTHTPIQFHKSNVQCGHRMIASHSASTFPAASALANFFDLPSPRATHSHVRPDF